MKIQDEKLKDLYADVREAFLEKLKNDDRLEDVNDVTFGERKHIGRMKSPSIWVVPNSYEPALRGGSTVEHNFTFDFVTLVKSNEPQKGLEKAQELAFLVYDVLVEDRTMDGTVNDVRPQRIDPAYDMGEQTQLFWAAVQFEFRLQRRE